MYEKESWLKKLLTPIITGLIVLSLSFGGVLVTTGQYKNKVDQLEERVNKAEQKHDTDHDIILEIRAKTEIILEMVKELKDNKKNKE